MRRALPFALVLAAIGACTFPDASYSDSGITQGDDSGGSSGSSSGGGSGSNSGGSGTDASSGSGSGGDGAGSSSGDASSDRTSSSDSPADGMTSDTTSSSSSGGDGSVDCDQDKDGFLAAGAPCNGNDCCDSDKNAHPMQMNFFTTQDACQSWDYNCNNMIDYQYPQNIPCTGTPALGCSGGPGFLGTEDCAQSGPYGACKANGALQCTLQQTSTAQQGCQ